ncbi:MAG: hypothetical protein NVS2B12_07280 [Ktedonobacteraceae bacterium]
MKPPQHYTLPLSARFMRLGTLLPTALYSSPDAHTALLATSYIEMFIFIALAFVVYACAALLIGRRDSMGTGRSVSGFIWLGTVAAGLVLMSMPVLLSQDVFVYADYGHSIVAHGANPFFVAPEAVSHDLITKVDNWGFATSAYGPVWMYICALFALVGGDHPGYYYVLFRCFAFACHLLNILLVNTILRASGSSPRMRAVGTLLYAWNPLLLLESCLGAHNDVLVNTFVLLGVYLALRAERQDFARPRNYVGPLLVGSLAVLVKFTMLPLVALFLVLLGCKTLERTTDSGRRRWLAAMGNVCLAGVIFIVFALVCYLPLWLGHSVSEIVKSFSTPPSAVWAENSFLRVIQEWLKANGRPAPNSPLFAPASLLSQRVVWDRISALALAGMLLVGAFSIWRRPGVHTLVRALLAALGVLLIVTPWFYPWYVQWLVALAVVLLARPLRRSSWALLAFTLTFSLSAMIIYLDPAFAPFGRVLDTRILVTTGLPVLAALLMFWIACKRDRGQLLS